MTLEQLKILKYIVEFGSLKEAGKRLHKTQPALSIAIKKLEAEFGFQMLDRNQYRLALSPEGDIFYREAVNLLNGADHLTSLGKQLAQGNEAVFRICFEFLSPQSLLRAQDSTISVTRNFCVRNLKSKKRDKFILFGKFFVKCMKFFIIKIWIEQLIYLSSCYLPLRRLIKHCSTYSYPMTMDEILKY